VASGWTWDSLQEYLMGVQPAPGRSPRTTVAEVPTKPVQPKATAAAKPTAKPAAKPTPKPSARPTPLPSAKPKPTATPAQVAHAPAGLHLGTPKFQPKRLLLPVTGSLKPVPLMLRTQADGRSYVDIPDATPAAAEPHGFHSPDGEFMDGVLAKGPHGGSRVTFRLKPGAIGRAFVSSAGVVIAVVTLPQH
jgi:hypothetical protein